MTDVMLDIETFGTNSNAAIIQVGACFFDMSDGKLSSVFRRNITLTSCLLAGLEVDKSTIDWWKQQSAEAKASLNAPAETLGAVLEELASFLSGHNDELVVWANGTDFDVALVKNAYARAGKRCPFKYNAGRDLRTIIDLAKRQGYQEPDFTPAVAHDALHDCQSQVARLFAAVQFLTVGTVPANVPQSV